MNPEPCSATVIAFNEEANIAACLQSLAWASEIVVVDSESTDRTVEIARTFTPRVFVQPWLGHQEQKNFALEKATHAWVFSLDADERVTPELNARILEILADPTQDGYRFPRRNYFLGKWMRYGGWYPDAVLRLFRKDAARFGGVNPHDKVVVQSGRVGDIEIPITHYTYTSFAQYVGKLHFYADIAARQALATGKTQPGAGLRLAVKPAWKFLETYVFKRGCLDGSHGLVAALGSSYMSYMKEARLWELRQANAKPAQ